MAYIRFADGHSEIQIVRLEGGLPFGRAEMEKWLKRDNPEAMEVSVSEVPERLREAVKGVKK